MKPSSRLHLSWTKSRRCDPPKSCCCTWKCPAVILKLVSVKGNRYQWATLIVRSQEWFDNCGSLKLNVTNPPNDTWNWKLNSILTNFEWTKNTNKILIKTSDKARRTSRINTKEKKKSCDLIKFQMFHGTQSSVPSQTDNLQRTNAKAVTIRMASCELSAKDMKLLANF